MAHFSMLFQESDQVLRNHVQVGQLALPNHHCLPPVLLEQSNVAFVSLSIPRQLGLPVVSVRGGQPRLVAVGVTMPKASVHEHGFASRRENPKTRFMPRQIELTLIGLGCSLGFFDKQGLRVLALGTAVFLLGLGSRRKGKNFVYGGVHLRHIDLALWESHFVAPCGYGTLPAPYATKV